MTAGDPHDPHDPHVPTIDAALVHALVAEQFPTWAGLPVRPVELDGWDNRTFRIGDELTARLPSAVGYVPQVRKEIAVLPRLALALSTPIPEIVAVGQPGAGYPYPWTLRRWIDGAPALAVGRVDRTDRADLERLARDVGAFLVELQRADAAGGPGPGPHSAGRGAGLAQFDDETRAAIRTLDGCIDGAAASAEWERGLAASVTGPAVWVHGDVAPGNLLLRGGRLAAVIDFGCAAVGDPACDLAIAWTWFDASARATFREVLRTDDALWARGRGWALWKALISLREPEREAESRRVLEALDVRVAN